MKRSATAVWKGGLKEGSGSITTESKVLTEVPYAFKTRFENAKGTNPEELVGAAHAACYSMALSASLEKENFKPQLIETKADVTLDKVQDNWTVTAIHLTLNAQVSGITQDKFNQIAAKTKEACPISRLLKADISLQTNLTIT